jgi:hypothetical protein
MQQYEAQRGVQIRKEYVDIESFGSYFPPNMGSGTEITIQAVRLYSSSGGYEDTGYATISWPGLSKIISISVNELDKVIIFFETLERPQETSLSSANSKVELTYITEEGVNFSFTKTPESEFLFLIVDSSALICAGGVTENFLMALYLVQDYLKDLKN